MGIMQMLETYANPVQPHAQHVKHTLSIVPHAQTTLF